MHSLSLHFYAKSSGSLYVIGWTFRCLRRALAVLFAAAQLTSSGTSKWAVVGMVVGSSDIMLLGVLFFLWLSMLPLHPEGWSPRSFQTPRASLQIFIFLPYWSKGMPAVLDVTMISTLQSLTLEGAASKPGYALIVGEKRKFTASEPCRSGGRFISSSCLGHLGGLQ